MLSRSHRELQGSEDALSLYCRACVDRDIPSPVCRASVRGIVKLVTDPGVPCCANGLMQRITEELELELGLRAPIAAVMAGYHSEAEVVRIACGVEKPHVAGKKDKQPWIE
jgi:hypothetical protein